MSLSLQTKIISFALATTLIAVASPAVGQEIVDPGIIPVDQTPVVPDTGGTGGQETGNISDSGDSNIDLTEGLDIEISPESRNQGFVGATAPQIQESGFVGAATEDTGPPLAEGATFGGGVNETGGRGITGGGRGTGGQGQGFGAATEQNGFIVTRRNLRARLTPRYDVRRISSAEVSSRFNNRFYRLPESDSFAGQFSVSIDNRVATITGAVPSQADSDRIVRQLRLEPGVYKIENQLQIVN